MVSGESFLSSFLEVLVDRLASPDHELLQEGARPELKRLVKMLMKLHSVLNDAEEKQLTNKMVKMWLDELQDLAYDVEDMLDEFANGTLERKLLGAHQTTNSPVPADFASSSQDDTIFGLKEISGRLEQLCGGQVDLGLQTTTAGGTSSSALWKRPPTTSLPTEPVLYGRDEDKSRIEQTLLNYEPIGDASFDVVSIVGMGGIGKTTLAREVYNTIGHFDLLAWIHVSDDEFDVLRISKVILESITRSFCDLQGLDQVQMQLKIAIHGKTLLLVLDDVWFMNCDTWAIFKSPFIAGADKVQIIVTTRLLEVAVTVGSGQEYALKLLSDDDCWSIFTKHAFNRGVIDEHINVDLLRQKVVEKCRGLPLAAKALGDLLRYKHRVYDWEDILNNLLWDSDEESGILSVLRPSYYHLPSHLKRCFAYCAIFPKNYEFKEEEVVMLWIAEGLIQSEDNKSLEDLGSEYFYNLWSRSIFQRSSSDGSKFQMHDLVHKLAQLVSRENILQLEDVMESNRKRRFFRVRCLSHSYGCYHDKSKFESFSELKNLRTFLPLQAHGHTRYISSVVLFDLLQQLKGLRVLSLRKYYINELPDSIGGSKNLRYLNFSDTQIRSLPESISLQFNLQFLILRGCSLLRRLPYNMEHLICLRHLDITGANLIEEMPLGVKKWEHLRTLSNFIVGKDVGSGVEDLKNLKFLCGKLCISRLENVTNPRKDTILSDKKDLKVLILEWGSKFDEPQDETVAKDVLDMLQPHRNLKELVIKCYGGIRFPTWVGEPSFSNMVILRLENCEKCTSLPSLGLLASLKDLIIEGMTGLKCIGSEIYGEDCSKPFLSLENLSFADLDEWEYWDPLTRTEQVVRFPSLHKLSIVRCPKLTGNLPDHLPSLEELVIHESAQLVASFSNLPRLRKLELEGCRGMICTSPTNFELLSSLTLSNIRECSDWFKHHFPILQCLQIVNCEELVYLWQEIHMKKQPNVLLTELFDVRELCIENCPNLKSLPWVLKFHHRLQSLRIGGCHSLQFIVKRQLPRFLERLEVKNCDRLQYLVRDEEADYASLQSSFGGMSRLSLIHFTKYLYISQCPCLTYIPLGSRSLEQLEHLEIWGCSTLINLSSSGRLPRRLQRIVIADCPELQSLAEMFDDAMSLEYIKIWGCKNLKCIPEGLHNLIHLNAIYIWDCPNLVSFPEGQLCYTSLTILSVERCMKLRALPDRIHCLYSLKELELRQCPSIMSIEEGFPTNLTSLSIADLNIFEPLIEWGLHRLTSLRNLEIRGCVYDVSFPQEENGMVLPASLTELTIARFPRLKHLSSNGFQNLTSLECLSISDCPNLQSFPDTGLPSSLLQLYIYDCPLLKKRCKRDKGEDWSKIADIPRVRIDGRFIYDPK